MITLRHIHRLHLHCASQDDARHGRVLIEDAMRTATLHDEDRLIVVRRLELGDISARASATEWSRRLEQRFRATRLVAVRFDAPSAASAEAVYFAHQYEPWLQLAQRAGAARPCGEWFWRAATPGWRPGMAAAETLRLSFRTLAAAGGVRLTLLLAQRLDEGSGLASLLRVLAASDLLSLQSELHGASQPDTDVAMYDTGLPPLAPEELAIVGSWGTDDLRTRWLAAAHLARTAGTRATLVPDIAAATRRTQAFIHAWKTALAAETSQAGEPRRATYDSNHPSARASETPPAPPTHPRYVERELTQIGGLFFAIPLLVRAGLPAFLATLPLDDRVMYPWQVLRLIGRHARAPAGDPLMQLTAPLPPAPAGSAHWLLRAHRLARSSAKVSLRGLVSRRAIVSICPTHITLGFHLDDADIRIRCAGLDIDPGWVPWLSRVVAFRFGRDE